MGRLRRVGGVRVPGQVSVGITRLCNTPLLRHRYPNHSSTHLHSKVLRQLVKEKQDELLC
jgi:hypothetical protein